MKATTEHQKRVKQQLIEAGITGWGLLKLEARYLPNIIHKNEHIAAIVYGKYKNGSGMLVASNRRVIFLDRKPLFTICDEITYDMVGGIGRDTEGPFSTVTLHTRLGDYKLSFVRSRMADNFIHFIEYKRLETNNNSAVAKHKKITRPSTSALLSADEQAFLLNHDIATLSTIDSKNNVNASVMHYILGENNLIYLITKSETAKVKNLSANASVALTIFDVRGLKVLQMHGYAQIEHDKNTKQVVFQQLIKPRRYGKIVSWPPVTKIRDGSYVVISITPSSIKFSDYK